MKVIKNDIKFNLFPIYIYIDGEKKGVVNFSKRTHINVEKGTHQLKLQCKIPFFSAEKTIEVEEQTVITFHNRSDKWLYLCLFDCLLVFLHFVLRLFGFVCKYTNYCSMLQENSLLFLVPLRDAVIVIPFI